MGWEIIRTLYVEDAVPQCAGDVGEGCLLRYVEEEVFCGQAGDGFDFLYEVFCVDVVSVVITQNLAKREHLASDPTCQIDKNISPVSY